MEEDAAHTGKKALIAAGGTAEEARQEARGFGARLWGRTQVGTASAVGGLHLLALSCCVHDHNHQLYHKDCSSLAPPVLLHDALRCSCAQRTEWQRCTGQRKLQCTVRVCAPCHLAATLLPLQEVAEDASAASGKASSKVGNAMGRLEDEESKTRVTGLYTGV